MAGLSVLTVPCVRPNLRGRLTPASPAPLLTFLFEAWTNETAPRPEAPASHVTEIVGFA